MNPHVVCVCLTADRQRYTDRAVKCFLSQTYENKSLLILDNGLVPYEPKMSERNIAIAHTGRKPSDTIGLYRNMANELAKGGDIIAHWDSDDWSHSQRIRRQVEALRYVRLCGLWTMPVWDSQESEAWEYRNRNGRFKHCLGTSLAYWRSCWEEHPFPLTSSGEEHGWQERFDILRAEAVDENGVAGMVAEIHAGNTCMQLPAKDRPARDGTEWTRRPDWDQRLEALMRL